MGTMRTRLAAQHYSCGWHSRRPACRIAHVQGPLLVLEFQEGVPREGCDLGDNSRQVLDDIRTLQGGDGGSLPRQLAEPVSQLRLHLVTDLRSPRYMNRFFTRRTEDVVADWGIDVRLHQWSVETLAEVAAGCDLAIVPVDLSDPMAVGKPENRMRIFWRLGLPVMASASPANVRAASLAGLGDRVLCVTEEDWRHRLERLYERPDDRLEIAEAGQATALTTYSEESLVCRWDQLFETL